MDKIYHLYSVSFEPEYATFRYTLFARYATFEEANAVSNEVGKNLHHGWHIVRDDAQSGVTHFSVTTPL